MARKIDSIIAPGVRDLRTPGDVPLPITWGIHFESLESGGFLEVKGSDGNDLSADSNGDIYVRAGSILVKNSPNQWRLLNEVADASGGGAAGDEPDGLNDAIMDATAVGILKQDANLRYGGGKVGIWIQGGFIAARMPSIAANGTPGLEATARAALTALGFRFAEDY